MRKYLEWAGRERRSSQVVAMLLLVGSLFIVGLPVVVVNLAGWLDQVCGLPRIDLGLANAVVGTVLLLGGGFLALWSVLALAKLGRGTPLPLVPTQRLVVVPPYSFCRNPMVLGTVLAYLSISAWWGSVSALAIVLVIGTILLLYVKRYEEKELRLRFGTDYEVYHRAAPLLLPGLRRTSLRRHQEVPSRRGR